MTEAQFDRKLLSVAINGIGRTFRGEIWENCERFQLLGGGYIAMPQEQDRHFQIDSARHLAGPLRALKDPNVRIVIIIGATQVMKSIAGDIWVPYIIEHEPRNMLVLFESDEKSKTYCQVRLMDTLKGHKYISDQISIVDRHDATKTEIKLPTMHLKVGGLNDRNCSSLSWPVIWVSEAWQHTNDGLLQKAIKRADRFPLSKKILIESQAGMAGDDLHQVAKMAHPVKLTWACPYCGGRQSWDFHQTRPDNFVGLPRFDGTGKLPEPKTYAGMMFESETELLSDGSDRTKTIEERCRNAYWECYHCGSHIQDTKDIRKALMDSYEQDYHITLADGTRVAPESVVFYLPKESAKDNPFSDSAKSYLAAKEAKGKDNNIPMRDWYLSERAIFFEDTLTRDVIVTATGSYDPNKLIADEHHRGLIIDAQKHLTQDTVGTFWYEAYVADKMGNSFQLERGFATSWEELRATQKKWKIPNHYVCIDGRKWTGEIVAQVASYREHWEAVHLGRKVVIPSTWKILMGDIATSFKWMTGLSRGKWKAYSEPRKVIQMIVNEHGKHERVIVSIYRWSNLAFKDQLQGLLIGGKGKPKFVALPREQLSAAMQSKEVGPLAYDEQMQSEIRIEKNGKPYWERVRKDNHYWDVSCMRLVRMAMDNLIGHSALAEVETGDIPAIEQHPL